jgi:sulfite reductase beta subunit-like hemoprotein
MTPGHCISICASIIYSSPTRLPRTPAEAVEAAIQIYNEVSDREAMGTARLAPRPNRAGLRELRRTAEARYQEAKKKH